MSTRAARRTPRELERQRARYGQDTRIERDARYSAGRTRTRYHGQARQGQPIGPIMDRTDVLVAMASLAQARDLLAHAATLPPGIGRREAHRTAIGQIALSARALDDLLLRRRVELT